MDTNSIIAPCKQDKIDKIIDKIVKLFEINKSSAICSNCNQLCHHSGAKYFLEMSDSTFVKIFDDHFDEQFISDLNTRFEERCFTIRLKLQLFDNLKKKVEEPMYDIVLNKKLDTRDKTIKIIQIEPNPMTVFEGIEMPDNVILNGTLVSDRKIYQKMTGHVPIYTGQTEETYYDPIYADVPVKRSETYTELLKSTEDIWIGYNQSGFPKFYERPKYIPITKTRVVENIEKTVIGHEKKTRSVSTYGKTPEYKPYMTYNRTPITISISSPTKQKCNKQTANDNQSDECKCVLCDSSDKSFVFGSVTEQWIDYFSVNNNIGVCLVCGGDHHNGQNDKFKQCDPIIKLYNGDIFEAPNDKYFKYVRKQTRIANNAVEQIPCTMCSCYRCIVDMNTNFISNAIYGLQFKATMDDVNVLQYRIGQKIPELVLTVDQIKNVLKNMAIY